MASVYRSVNLPLPETLELADVRVLRRFQDLLARFMPFDLVIDEETRDGEKATVSKTSVCGSWGAVAGTLRYFADRYGIPRASIEGTQLPLPMLRRYARRGTADLSYDANRKHAPLALTRRLEYFGFELERETERVDEFPPEAIPQARRVLAEALARQEARHPAVKRNRTAIEEIRELWRRSGGHTPRLGQSELADLYARLLDEADVRSIQDFRATPLLLDLDGWVDDMERERLAALPDNVEVRGRTVPLDYDVEEVPDVDASPYRDEAASTRTIGVVRLRLPEKLARTLADEELPELDRPVRFIVLRGQRGAVRAGSLEELQELLDRPWSPEEAEADITSDGHSHRRRGRRRDRDASGPRPDHRRGPSKGRKRGATLASTDPRHTGERRRSGRGGDRRRGRG